MPKHEWMTYEDANPGDPDWEGDTDIAPFAGLDEGIHNGPKCRVCGRDGFCKHCAPDVMDEECPGA